VPAVEFSAITLPPGSFPARRSSDLTVTVSIIASDKGAGFDETEITVAPLVFAGPDDTTRLTADPAATEVPAVGVCEITLPAGTVDDACVVIVPTTKPAAVIAVVAAVCGSPAWIPMLSVAGLPDTARLTADPAATEVPAVG